MRKLTLLCCSLFLLLSGALAQQVHTFTFGPLTYGTNSAPMIKLDGIDANCGIGYCGTIQVRGQFNSYWGLFAPQEGPDGLPPGWGFPNNGQLPNNTVTPDQGPLTFDSPACQAAWTGQPSKATLGCTSHTYTEVPLQGYGDGVVVTVTANYQINVYKDRYGRYTIYKNDSTGGSGTATYTPPGSTASSICHPEDPVPTCPFR